ncbi:MAG: hypothetical protein QXG91_02025 [Candidatus Aenigmatarchaeota archaeon]
MRKIIYIKFLLYYILVVLLVSLSTIVLHEIGHFIFGLISKCSEIKVVLIDQTTYGSYTEMRCPPTTNTIILGLSGFFIVLPISFLYLFRFKNFERYVGLLIFGFNLIISVDDFNKYLKIPFAEIFSIFGIILVMIGEYKMIKSVVD